tara:strand:+ start:1391 stop:2881 length:1491 start_codon:yes stop_codon:yes gene_type:complete
MRYLALLLTLSTLWPNDGLFREKIRIRQDFDVSNTLYNHQYRNEEELIDFIDGIVDLNNIPGLSVSVVEGENIVWNKSFGMANLEENIMVSDSTMFMLASVSKTVTATALMKLWESGLINLNQDINNYLPFEVKHPDFPLIPITAKMLLSHTSGIKDNWSVMPYYEGDSDIELSVYLEEYLVPGGDFYNQNLNFTNNPPGANFSYSNIGAALIGYLVESISSQPFNEYCNQHIFEPLDISGRWFLSELDISNIAIPYETSSDNSGDSCYDIGCGVFNSSNPCQCDQACNDYGDCCDDYNQVCGEDGTGDGVGFSPIDHYGYSDYPSGQLRVSSLDLAKFLVLFNNRGIYQGVRILEEETVEYMKSIPYPHINSQQAFIWYYKNQAGRSLFGHNGGDLAVSADMFISLSDEVGVIIILNCANYNSMIQVENAVFDFSDQYGFNILGDLNSDMALNILDVILLSNAIIQGSYLQNGDINNDEILSVQDIILLINIILS